MASKNLFHFLAETLRLAPSRDNGHHHKPVQMGRVVPDANRCVQCGICGYNCPIGIPVRDYAHRGLPVDDPRCITCGQCIEVCPRGTLRWETQMHAFISVRFPNVVDPAAMSDEPITLSNK